MSMSKKNTITSILESASQSGALSPSGSSLSGVASVGNSQALKTPNVMSFSRMKPSSPAAPVKDQALSTKSRQVTQDDMDSVSVNLFPASPPAVQMNTPQYSEVVRNQSYSTLPPSPQSISPIFPVSGSSSVNMSNSPVFPQSISNSPSMSVRQKSPSSVTEFPTFNSSTPSNPSMTFNSSMPSMMSPSGQSMMSRSQPMSSTPSIQSTTFNSFNPSMLSQNEQSTPRKEVQESETMSQQSSKNLIDRISDMKDLTYGQTISSDAAQKLSMLKNRSNQSMSQSSQPMAQSPQPMAQFPQSSQSSQPMTQSPQPMAQSSQFPQSTQSMSQQFQGMSVRESSQSPPRASSPSSSILKSNIMSNLNDSNKTVSLSERLQQSRQMSMRPSISKSPDSKISTNKSLESSSKKSLAEKVSEMRSARSQEIPQEMTNEKQQEKSQEKPQESMTFSKMKSQLKSTDSSSKKSLAEKVSELRQMSAVRSSLSQEKTNEKKQEVTQEKKELEKIKAEASKIGIVGFEGSHSRSTSPVKSYRSSIVYRHDETEGSRSRSTSPVKSYRSSIMSRHDDEDVIPAKSMSEAPMSFKTALSSITEKETESKSKLREQVSKLKEANSNLYNSKMSEEPKSVHSSMSLKPMSPSRTVDYALKVDNITAVETGEEKPKIDDDEPMAKHRRLFNDLGITFIKMFTDSGNETVYLHGVNKNGGHIVVEDRNHSGTFLYLIDGHIIEQHTGEELNLSKRIVEKECEALGTCGMFSHDGPEIVVSKKTNGKIHKVQYLISSTVNERSIIESHGVVTIPVVQFQDLQNPDRKYVDSLLETADAKFVEYNKKAMDDVESRMARVSQMTLALEASENKFIKNVSVGISNFKIALKTLSENFEFYTKSNDTKMLEKCSIARKELFDDIQEFIIESHKIEKMIEHAMTVKDAIDRRNKVLVAKLSKYSV